MNLVITRVSGRRPAQEWRFHPFWVRVELEENEDLETCGPLWLKSHGGRLQVGAFLGPTQLRAFSGDLRAALAAPSRISGAAQESGGVE